MSKAIVLEGLGKTYTRRLRKPGFVGALSSYFSLEKESFEAVKDLSFSINRGESVGLIGENGAGKSTTVKMLTGILVPTAGRVETLGLNPWQKRKQLAMNIGVVFGQKPQLLWDIPAGESFKLLKAMYQISNETYKFTFHKAVELLDLGPLLKTPVRLLSLGQRMRCDLAASLLHAPAVAFLDEPTIGLDVLVKEQVREHLREMRRRYGTTILLTTHDLKDIAETSSRLIVLDKGQLLFDGDLRAFEKRYAKERDVIVDLSVAPKPKSLKALETALKKMRVSLEWEDKRRIKVCCKQASAAPKVTALLLEHLSVKDLSLHGSEIDAIVTSLYKKQLRKG